MSFPEIRLESIPPPPGYAATGYVVNQIQDASSRNARTFSARLSAPHPHAINGL